MTDANREDLIYDWNTAGPAVPPKPKQKIEFDDETLRDGLQSPSVRNPLIEQKIEILHLMDGLGIDTADVGLPGAGPKAWEHVSVLCREIVRSKLQITPNCAARTVEADIRPIAEVQQKEGIPVEACLFIGSSPIRQYAEDWTVEKLLEHTEKAIRFAVGQGLKVMYVTEDTIRSKPETLKQMYSTAIRCGASRVCLCDTVGHATPEGAHNLVLFVRNLLKEINAPHVKIDWHGHMDRGLGIPNTIAAIMAGADRVHGCALGIGERVGNTPMDVLLVNLKLLGWIDNDLRNLATYCDKVSLATGVPIHRQYPVVGQDAFETATGVHAAAVIKAYKKKDNWLADRVYSGVPAGDFGRAQSIRIGPMSGRSNILYWLDHRGIPTSDALVDRIFQLAKQSDRLLEDHEVLAAVGAGAGAGAK